MVKLQVKGYVQDRGVDEVWNKTYDFELNNETPIEDIVEQFLREEREYGDEDITLFKELLESEKWYGGKWRKNKDTIKYETDVMEETFRVVK